MFQEHFVRHLFELVNCHSNFIIHGKGEGGFDTLVSKIENIVVLLVYPNSWKL